MEADPGMSFHLQTVAENAGMSRSKFQQLFYLLFAQHPYSCLQELRMQRARELLEEQQWSVKEISYKTGFKNLSSFSTAFKRRFGFKPSSLL